MPTYISEEESDHEKSDAEELAMNNKLEAKLKDLAADENLFEDLRAYRINGKLRRETKNQKISAQSSLAKILDLSNKQNDNLTGDMHLTEGQIDGEAEKATKSIGGSIANVQMQNYYKAFGNKTGLPQNSSAKALFMNSHPFSNYRPLPDQNILAMLNEQQQQDQKAGSGGVNTPGGQNNHSRSMGSHPESQQFGSQTQNIPGTNPVTNIPAAHFQGVYQFFNQAALNEESFLRQFGSNAANNKVVEISLDESGGNFESNNLV